MTISGASSPILAAMAGQPDANGVQGQAQVLMLKKAQDQMKLEGAAMVQMVEQSVPPQSAPTPPLLDTYA